MTSNAARLCAACVVAKPQRYTPLFNLEYTKSFVSSIAAASDSGRSSTTLFL